MLILPSLLHSLFHINKGATFNLEYLICNQNVSVSLQYYTSEHPLGILAHCYIANIAKQFDFDW